MSTYQYIGFKLVDLPDSKKYVGLRRRFMYNLNGHWVGWQAMNCLEPPWNGGLVYCGPDYLADRVYEHVDKHLTDVAKPNWMSTEELNLGGPVPTR